MKRNPRAPRGALSREDLRPGLKVVVISGGLHHHEHVQILSKPYSETVPLATLYDRKTGKVGEATLLAVKVRAPKTDPFTRGTYDTDMYPVGHGLLAGQRGSVEQQLHCEGGGLRPPQRAVLHS